MIRKVSFRNFKCLQDVQICLEPFTVFVGPNGSGKSSILQALDALCGAFHARDAQQGNAVLLPCQSRGAVGALELYAEHNGKAYRYRTESPWAPNPGSSSRWSGRGRGIAESLEALDWKEWTSAQGGDGLPRSVLLRLEPAKLVQPTLAEADPTIMSPSGSGLHSSLASMALNDPDSWQRVQGELRRIIPTISRLRHTPTKPQRSPELLFDTVGGDSLPASQVSEGTLLVLGLLAALHSPARPNLVLLDDVDRGLHPNAQRELIALLREVLKASPDMQILATTHSPYLLDCMEPNEVRMTYLERGFTVCAPLTKHPDFLRWKDEFHSGEMWSLFGEKWVTEPAGATP